MKRQLEQVAEFHRAFNMPILKPYEKAEACREILRIKLLKEELSELLEAVVSGDIVHIAKESIDCQYVLLGTFLEFGWEWEDKPCFSYPTKEQIVELLAQVIEDVDAITNDDDLFDIAYMIKRVQNTFGISRYQVSCFDEVHRSNMSKLDENGRPVYREDGKVLKSALYSPADLSFLT